jgi:hypothetical protein
VDPCVIDQTPLSLAFLSPRLPESKMIRLTLLSLTPLSTNVKQLVRQVPDDKGRLADPRRLDPCA